MARNLRSGLRQSLKPSVAGGLGNNDIFTTASLDLNFAKYKNLGPLVDATTGTNLVDHTRASSGTYVGSDGLIKTATTDEPRFDHDPTTGESLGLLVEESRTNLLLRSEEFDDASWTKQNATISADSITAPNGLSSADTLTDNANNTDHRVIQNLTLNGGAFAFSVYAKKGTASFVRLRANDGTTDKNVWFNLNTGQVATGAVNVSASMVDVGNGWYRCIGTWSASYAGLESYTIAISEADAVTAYAGTGKTIYLWGAQLEVGPFPTSYIPTAGSTVTRSADVASISGNNFSSWYRQDEGTVFVGHESGAGIISRRIVSINDTTADNIIQVIRSNVSGSAENYSEIVTLGSGQGLLGTGTAYTPGRQTSALAYATNNVGFTKDGGAAFFDNTVSIPTVSTFEIGASLADNFLNGTISRLTYWPTRLPDETLQQITT